MYKHFLKLGFIEVKRNILFVIFQIFALLGYYLFFTYVIRIPRQVLRADYYNEMAIPLFMVTIATLPMIIYYSFALERRAKTNYMLFSFPIHRKSLMISKFGAFMTPLVILPFVAGGMEILSRYIFILGPTGYRYLGRYFISFIINDMIFFVSAMIFISGLLCAAESLSRSIKHFNLAAVFILIMGSQAVVLWSTKFTMMYGLLGDYNLRRGYGAILNAELLRQNMAIVSQYVAFVGILLFVAAQVIYEKYAEV